MKPGYLLCLSLLWVTACNADDQLAGMPGEIDAAIDATSETTDIAVAKQEKDEAYGSLRLGDEIFKFDQVFCFKGQMATAIASDAQRRSRFPTITIKTIDKSLTGGVASDTANAIFNDDNRKQHWYLKSGTVKKSENSFAAYGFIEGKRMITLPNGNLEPSPSEDPIVMAFNMTIKCRG